MNTFKPGDRVRRTTDNYNGVYVGDENIVSDVTLHALHLEGYSGGFDPGNFELLTPAVPAEDDFRGQAILALNEDRLDDAQDYLNRLKNPSFSEQFAKLAVGQSFWVGRTDQDASEGKPAFKLDDNSFAWRYPPTHIWRIAHELSLWQLYDILTDN